MVRNGSGIITGGTGESWGQDYEVYEVQLDQTILLPQ